MKNLNRELKNRTIKREVLTTKEKPCVWKSKERQREADTEEDTE